jgi:hypothetical protein
MTKAERWVLRVLAAGGTVWCSAHREKTAWLCPPGNVPGRRVRLSTLDSLSDRDLIESEQAYHGWPGKTPGDITWSLTDRGKELMGLG